MTPERARSRGLRALAIAALVAVAIVASIAIVRAVEGDLARPRDLHRVAHATSGECRRCHPSHYESWARTFHRTMTQEAREGAVLGDFDHASFEYGGITARMDRTDDGGFEMTFAGAEGVLSSARVVRTVGSRRVQQYLAREGDLYLRLPLAWHVEERRWMHMNGAFLTPDPEPPPEGGHIDAVDYYRHVTRWNDNCVFCHNVAPDPGWDPERERWQTEVAELGIACGACHGPGEEHVRANTSPIRRYALHVSSLADPTIVSPARLPPERSAEICGRCHGQRITDDVGRFVRDGDPFVPGDRLSHYSRPLARDTPLRGDGSAFAARFWRDGTARLTAYEYQGLLQSACVRGGMTCIGCHGMHEGDPRGQIRPSAQGDAACTGCHEELGARREAERHAQHRDVACVDCHMPRIVYGLVEVHRSHRVEIPNPARDAGASRPDACTLCHADRSLAWAVEGRARLWGSRDVELEPERGSHIDRMALGGDPIARSIGCAALGRTEALRSEGDRARRLGILLDVMTHDPYPAVRRIAWRSARALAAGADAGWDAYVPTAELRAREALVGALRERLGELVRAPDPRITEELRARATEVAIEIGE